MTPLRGQVWWVSLDPVRDAVAVIDQIRAISKDRLRQRLGELSADHLDAVERALSDVLELA